MNNNIFEELKERKDKIKELIIQADSFGWIDNKRKEEMLDKLSSDTLTIGVIGQMKCGKSTFLNTFVFEDTILPAATTPMTAALSVITYGDKEQIEAEFYTADEWEEQKMQAARSIEEAQGNAAEESKIKAAKELVSKSSKLGANLNSLLGKTQEDSFDNLIEYVGADGKYISITKSVTIYYPKEYLKGVEIVDTPGFNDPIISREERTKDFLKKADVVLMMLYAGRPFDATDRDIIFKNVRQCGIGKVLIGINKYDIPYCSQTNPEDENQIKDYVVSELKKACRECDDNIMVEILNETTPIPLSAEMALLSYLPMSKISTDEALKFAWNRHCENFGISTQSEMRTWSHIMDLTNAVKNMVSKEKDKILFSKPINSIIAAGSDLQAKNEQQIQLLSSELELLQMPDSEIEEKEEKLNKAERKLNAKISSLGDDIESEIRNIIRKGKNQLEDDVDGTCNRMRNIVESEWHRLTNFDSKIKPKLDAEISKLQTRTLKRSVETLAENAKRVIDKTVGEFFKDSENILMRYLPEFDSQYFIKKVKNQIEMEVTEKDLFRVSKDTQEYGILDFIGDVLNGASWGILGKAFGALTYNENKAEVLNDINTLSSDFDPKPYLEAALNSKQEVIDTVKNAFIDSLIKPLQRQLEDVKNNKSNKEARLNETKVQLENCLSNKKILSEQMASVMSLKEAI